MKLLRNALLPIVVPGLILTTTTTAAVLSQSTATAAPTLKVPNGSFEAGTQEWVGKPAKRARLKSVARSHSGDRSVSLRTVRKGTVRVKSTSTLADPVEAAGASYAWTGHVRGNRTGLVAKMVVREVAGGEVVQTRSKSVSLKRGTWQPLSVELTTERPDSRFRIAVVAVKARPTDRLLVDTITVTRQDVPAESPTTPAPTEPAPTTPAPTEPAPTTPAPTTPETQPGATDAHQLTNGCGVSERGIPKCGALFGAGFSDASDMAATEKTAGRPLGVRRTYYQGNQVDNAIKTVKADLAAGRLPWISFKAPYSWAEMANGAGDAWAKDLATKLSKVDGPVWVAVHHEPQGDGKMANWTTMQERLAPIIRKGAPNAAYSIILTGWNALYGPAEDRLENLWPDTKVDVAGFDSYNQYGIVKNGKTVTKHTDLANDYFKLFDAWAKKKDLRWAIAETGYSHAAAKDNPKWMAQTYDALEAQGGIAMTYFNSTRNSVTDWSLSNDAKKKAFVTELKAAPGLKN